MCGLKKSDVMNIKFEHNIQSMLRLMNIYFDSFEFKHTGFPKGEIKLNVNFKVHDEYDDDLKIHILANIIAENAFELRADLVGIFDVDEEWVDKLKANAVAIMFPYLRSQLTLLTSQPEMMPIILPTVNINKLLESNKDK